MYNISMNKTLHSPEFIEEMKNRLLEDRRRLKGELERVADNQKGDFRAKFPDYGRHEDENAIEVADYEALTAATEAYEAQLESVEAALRRIEDGTYGVTSDGLIIPEERLRANPSAETVVGG